MIKPCYYENCLLLKSKNYVDAPAVKSGGSFMSDCILYSKHDWV